MSEDLIVYTAELPNGVKLTWPSNLNNTELYTSAEKLLYFIVRLNKESIQHGSQLSTDGPTLFFSRNDGLRQELEHPFIEDSSIVT